MTVRRTRDIICLRCKEGGDYVLYIQVNEENIPGTILNRKKMGDVTGKEFLNKIFYLTDGIMLSQIREISGIDGSTLQNWTKRGWVDNSKLKRYNIDQVAHILLINMLRDCLQLDKIAFLIRYINGQVNDRSDDIIKDSDLYDFICKLLDKLICENEDYRINNLRDCIAEVVANYDEKITGARKRIANALDIIIIAHYASIIKQNADMKLDVLINK